MVQTYQELAEGILKQLELTTPIHTTSALLAAARAIARQISSEYPTIADGCGTDLYIEEIQRRSTTFHALLKSNGCTINMNACREDVINGHHALVECKTPWGDILFLTAKGIFHEIPDDAFDKKSTSPQTVTSPNASFTLEEELPF